MNTKISYMYRDAGNYKNCGTVVAEGKLTNRQIEELKGFDQFIAEQVGLAPLQEGEYNPEYDHPYHEVTDVELTEEEPTIKMTAKQLYQAFTSVMKWDESLSGYSGF
nr:hypothetical protein BdHM001_36090 [Bdellovibrio sp. HM001]